MAKSILDPDKIGEFHRQQHMEYEAMRQREEKEMRLREKQVPRFSKIPHLFV
jgi:hypothetical protein